MKVLKFILMLCLAVSVFTTMANASGFQLNEHGARAMGMAGAFAAQASDPSALFFNPAGLAFQKGTRFSLGTTMITLASRFSGPAPSASATDMVKNFFFPVNAYAAHAMDNGLAFGIGFYSPYGLGTEWPSEWVGHHLAVRTDIRTFFINPTIAYRLNDQFSIGAGASFVLSDVNLRYRVPTYSSLAPPTPAAMDGTASLEANDNAINFNFGILYKPMENLSLGASYRHTTKLSFVGTAAFKDMQALSSFFPGGDASTAVTLPNNIFVGVAYEFSQDLTFEFDFQSIGWSSYDELSIDIAPGPSAPPALGGAPLQKSPAPAKKNWKNSYILRFGGEYRYNEYAFRAGFIYDKTPQPDATLEPMLPDANRSELALGFGYKVSETMRFDLAYMYILFADRTVVPAVNKFPGTYQTRANLLAINLEYGL